MANKSIRGVLNSNKMLIAPGAYDCITAALIEQAGFDGLYMTGAGTSASLGYPDFGLLTMTEMVENAGRIASRVGIPLISDADTGYGNELNVYRTVQEFERRGVAAIHIEDQQVPKKCGHLDDKQLVSVEDYEAKIRAAVAARTSSDFVIIARTDSRAVEGFDAAIQRVNSALAAGADVAFVEAPQTLEEVEAVPKLVKGPCLLNVVHNGKTPPIDLEWAEKVGYRIAIVPGLMLRTTIGACDAVLAELKAKKRHPSPPNFDKPLYETFRRFGADTWNERRTTFRKPT
jgi:2-methylisocitrate lyase-like PEP mutase family enzyme